MRSAEGRRNVAELLQHASDTGDVFCSSELLSLGVMTEACEQGRAMPDQLAMASLGDLVFAADLSPAMTTARDLMGLGAGTVLDGKAMIADVGWQLYGLVLEVVGGRQRTWSERWHLRNALVS